MYIAVALIVVALLYHIADSIITSSVDLWLKVLYLAGMTLVIGSVIWVLAFVSPKFFQVVPQMIKANDQKEKDSVNEESFVRIDNSGKKEQLCVTKVAIEEESESEKLLREFKNRRL